MCFNSLSTFVSVFSHLKTKKNSLGFNSLSKRVFCIERHKMTRFDDCLDESLLSAKLFRMVNLSQRVPML